MQESSAITASVGQEVWSERWHLAALRKEDFIRIGMLTVIVGLLFVIFHLQGNTTDVRAFGRSTLWWMERRWAASGGDLSHGYLIPFVSLGLLWYKRKEFFQAEKKVSGVGLFFLVGALLLHWIGAKAQQPRLSLMALIGIFWSMPFYFYGWQVAKRLMFICSYLIFCIPLNFLDSLTFPLRMLVTVISTATLNGLGIAVRRSGSAIYTLAGGGFSFDVADPCSGLRSLLAMTALTAVYAYLTQKTVLKKWILFLCSIPLAIIGNIFRITTIALVAEVYGEDLALGLYHDYSGYVFFSVAIGLMIGVGALLNTDLSEVWTKWKKNAFKPYIVVIVLLICTSLALAYTVDVTVTNEAGIRMDLPDRVGEWRGQDLFFCQNSECRKQWHRDELEDVHSCPACGGELDTMTLAERRMLPADTEIIKKRYRHPAGREVFVSIVLSGKERVSIHRPQVCLVGQGREIVESDAIEVDIEDRDPLGVMVLDLLVEERVGKDRVVDKGTYYAYWFVGKDRETPYHLERMFWMAADRIFRNVSHRWAYISVGGVRNLENDRHEEEIREFVKQLYPSISLTNRS